MSEENRHVKSGELFQWAKNLATRLNQVQVLVCPFHKESLQEIFSGHLDCESCLLEMKRSSEAESEFCHD